MSSSIPPPASLKDDADDATLIAAQQAFLTSGSKPAAKILRASSPKRTEPEPHASDSPETEGSEWRQGPGWYQQMKGVRFRLDDLEGEEDDDVGQEDVGTSGMGSRRRERTVVDRQESGAPVMGDIVERTTSVATPVFAPRGSQKSTSGFPAPRKFGRPQPKQQSAQQSIPASQVEEKTGGETVLEGKELMEEIDRENRKKMAEMSEEEILELQRSLQASLSSEFRELLLRKDKIPPSSGAEQNSPSSKAPTPQPQTTPKPSISPSTPSEASNPTTSTPPKKSPPKPSTTTDPFEDDKSFDEHLRTFFPPATTTVPPPEWTLPVHPAEETFYSQPDASRPDASTMRFDLQGKYIPSTTSRSLPTHLGLHHHSLDPGAAGYTLAELAILARSIQPSQKCIALKILGGVLTDVAAGTYPWDIQEGLWDEIERERAIEIVLEVAKGGREMGGNRSVQRYAEDAVSKWVAAGGPKQWEQRLQKKGFEKVPDSEE